MEAALAKPQNDTTRTPSSTFTPLVRGFIISHKQAQFMLSMDASLMSFQDCPLLL